MSQFFENHSILIRMLPAGLRRYIEPGSALIKVLDNIGWLFFDKILRMGVGLLVGVWVARYLGPEQFGALAYIIAIVAIFQGVTSLGLDNIAIRDISRKPMDAEEILGSIFRLRILAAFICYFCVLVIVFFLKSEDQKSLLLASIIAGVMLFQSSDVVDIWFQSKLQSKRSVLAKTVSCLVSNGFRVILVLLGASVEWFGTVVLLEAMLNALAMVYAYKKYPTARSWNWNLSLSFGMLKEGFPFLLSGVMLSLYLQLDKILIERLGGGGELGLYMAAASLVNVFLFFPMIVFQSFAPKISGILEDKMRISLFSKIVSLMIWVSTVLAMALWAFSEVLVDVLYGGAYTGSGRVLSVMSFSLIFIFLSVANDYYALAIKKSYVTLIRTAGGLLMNSALNFLLIPSFGAVGAAVACVGAHALSNTIIYWVLTPSAFRVVWLAIFYPFKRVGSI